MKKIKSPFKAGTGLMGATEAGQKVTPENIKFLPPGTTVHLEEIGSWLIHLHDGLWLLITGPMHCYDKAERFSSYLKGATVSHLPN